MFKTLITLLKNKLNKDVNLLSTDEYLVRYIFSFCKQEKYRLVVSQVCKLWRKNIHYYNPEKTYAVYLCRLHYDYYENIQDKNNKYLWRLNELKNVCREQILSSPNYNALNCCKNALYASNLVHIKFNFEFVLGVKDNENEMRNLREFCSTYYFTSLNDIVTNENIIEICDFMNKNSLLQSISSTSLSRLCGRKNLDLLKYICDNNKIEFKGIEIYYITNSSNAIILQYIFDRYTYRCKGYDVKMAIDRCIDVGWNHKLKVLLDYVNLYRNEPWVLQFGLEETKYFTQACENGYINCVKVLLNYYSHYAQPNVYPGLCRAAWKGHLNIIKFLVERGADYKFKNFKLERIAIKYGNVHVYNYLYSLRSL